MDKGKDIGEDKKVEDWFRRIRASESAKASYIKGLQYFMDFLIEKDIAMGNTPTELLEYSKGRFRRDALDWKDEIDGVIAEFEAWLREKPKIFTKGDYDSLDLKLAPKTIHTYISAVKSFFNAFNIDIPRSKRRRQPKTLVENNHRLTKEIVNNALKFADVRSKAVILTMLSGGLGDSELLNLKVSDFIRGRGYEPLQIGDFDAWINEEKRKCEEEIKKENLEHGITSLNLRRQKTEVDYITFISPEATIAVLDYLTWRNRPSGYTERFKGIGKIREEKRKVRHQGDYLFIKAYVDDWYLPPEVIEELKPAKIAEGETNSKHKSRATTEIIKEVQTKRKEQNLRGYADEVRKLNRSGLMAIFRDLAKKTGISTDIGIYQLLRGHNLRKLFYTLLRNEGADSFSIEFWMGHTIPEEQEVYFQAIPDKLKSLYAKYVHVLLIGEYETKFLVSASYKELKSQNESLKERIAVIEAREAEKEPYENITTELMNDPEMRGMIKKWLEKKAG